MDRSSRAVVLLLVFAGCDPLVSVTGRVGAGFETEVQLRCPGRPTSRWPSSVLPDADGGFDFGGLGCLPKACRVTHGDAGVEIGDVCNETYFGCSSRDSCSRASVVLP